MRRLLILFFLFIFFIGCKSGNTPAGILPKNKMIDVLLDMHLADGYTSSITDTPKTVGMYQSLYRTHGIDSATFKKNIEYYSKDPELLNQMYAVVTNRLKKMEVFEQKKDELKKKHITDSLKKYEKLIKDSLRRDSIKRGLISKKVLKKDSLKKDSLRKETVKKFRLKKKKTT